ncbi:MAG: DUF4337 domain-containing protein [Nitrospirae bacterium]|nr:DUF4337 domain-containing protein [Nitrospirota bacterium]
MAEEKKEKWLNYLAMTTVIIAVCATLSTFKGGSFSTRSVLSQSQASDQWAYFQAKSIKGYLYELQKERFELELKGGRLPKAVADEYADKIAAYDEKLKKYKSEKAEIEKTARDLEKTRDEAQKHSQSFGMAIIFLQIAILLSSIAALMKKKPLWIIGLCIAAFGLIYFANGFLMFNK